MKISVFGTGMVGRAHAARLADLGMDVCIGTNDVKKTFAENKDDAMGNPPFRVWHTQHTGVKLVGFEEAAQHGEIIIEALKGEYVVKILKPLGKRLAGKIIIDVSNPLDYSKGMPPNLFVSNTDSLGEQLQQALPLSKIVKSLNTVSAPLQVDPGKLADGDHTAFVSGNDTLAKERVTEFLKKWYGWKNVIDLGDITTARGAEMVMALWIRLWNRLKTPMFNYKVVTT
jgi:8-hydroxy-5-deazaflavin:NADPH oxidoreductase